MAYLISEEAQDLLSAVKDFCDSEVKEQCKEYDRSGEWPKEMYDKAIEMQLTMLEVPEQYGGMGLSRVDVAALIEEMAKADAGFATTISASAFSPHRSIGMRTSKPISRTAPCAGNSTRSQNPGRMRSPTLRRRKRCFWTHSRAAAVRCR